MMLVGRLFSPPASSLTHWQQAMYGLVNRIDGPTFPQTVLTVDDDDRLIFTAYAAFIDTEHKYKSVIYNQTDIPNWALVMRVNGKRINEMSHRGTHNGVPCNVFSNDRILFHILTAGSPEIEIMVRVWNTIIETKYDVVSYLTIDKVYDPPGIDRVSDLEVLIWAFPHPKIKNLIVVIAQGYMKSIFPLTNSKIQNSVRWHINSVMENFGEKLK